MVDLLGALKVLADDTRLRVVRLLRLAKELNVGELQRSLWVSQPSVSRALSDLKKAGLVRERGDVRAGGFVFYELVKDGPLLDRLETDIRDADDAEGDAARLAEV